LYEELEAEEPERTREVYRECLKLIPHKKFSFAKMWLMAAQFEIRQKDLKAMRQILGSAIGMAPKDKVFALNPHQCQAVGFGVILSALFTEILV
jgi:crooked neck